MRFFLSRSFIFFNICFLLFWWFLGLYFLLWLQLLFLILSFFVTRRSLSPHRLENEILKEGVFYAPVNGRVSSLTFNIDHPKFGENLTEIVFTLPWWRENGLYFPAKSEVSELSFERGDSYFRYFQEIDHESIDHYSGIYLKLLLRSDNPLEYGIQLIKCPLGMWPRVRVIPGDLGRAQVNFGFFGLGGTVALYLSGGYEILVKEGLRSIAGQTIIAASTKEDDKILRDKE